MVKVSLSGEKEWIRLYGGLLGMAARDIAISEEGEIFVSGTF